ncbi:AsnC family transcriptional regulator [Amycolatopsis sp. NPDC051128]|uniref:Lrp/AsnC family transcriptional regulator n=1 Tax=Amycolatopsis sp. NPDC051128 TaxID=3155412 RepID=UPI003447B3F8
MGKSTLDSLELQILHALQVDGRISFSRLGKILGVSDQTVARRYRRLQSDIGMSVVARLKPAPLRQAEWFVRLRTAPDAAKSIAAALARREDTSWVSLTSGGTEIVCVVRTPVVDDRRRTLLHRLANTPQVVSVTAHKILNTFVGGPVAWPGMTDELSREQLDLLHAGLPEVDEVDEVVLGEGDRAILNALLEDGRSSLQRLAEVSGWAENTVRRRLEALRANGVLFFDIDVDFHLIGFDAQVLLWLQVRPQRLVQVAEALTRHAEISFAAATTGSTNLLAFAICRDSRHLFEYLTGEIGGLDGIGHVETAPVMQILKLAIRMTPE